MYCDKCNSVIEDDASFCTNCGSKLNKTNKVINTNAYEPEDEDLDFVEQFGWGAFGFFLPLIGVILYFSWRKIRPQKAKSIGIGALIKLVAALIIFIFAIAYSYYNLHN